MMGRKGRKKLGAPIEGGTMGEAMLRFSHLGSKALSSDCCTLALRDAEGGLVREGSMDLPHEVMTSSPDFWVRHHIWLNAGKKSHKGA